MFKRILVPTDGSYRSKLALKFVERLSQAEPIDLTLLSVKASQAVGQPAIYHGVTGRTTNFTRQKKAHSDATNDFNWIVNQSQTQVNQIRLITEEGAPADRIVEVATSEKIDLIVMASHGYSAFDRFMYGSVTEAVIGQAPCPVLAVKNDHIPKHFLIALDKSPVSERILKPAITLAGALGAKITLTYVRTKEDLKASKEFEELQYLDRELYKVIAKASSGGVDFYLDDVMEKLQDQLDVTVDYIVKEGRPAKEILNVAADNRCDLIAMNTHDLKGLRFAWKSSTTQKIFELTQIPMLISHFQDDKEDD